MQWLVPLAGLLGIEVEALTEQVKRTIIVNTVMVLLLSVGVFFLALAGFVALAQQIGVIYSALTFSGVALLLALVVFTANRVSQARLKRLAAERRRSSDAGAFVTTAAMSALPALPGLLKVRLVRTLALPAAAAAAVALLARRNHRLD